MSLVHSQAVKMKMFFVLNMKIQKMGPEAETHAYHELSQKACNLSRNSNRQKKLKN